MTEVQFSGLQGGKVALSNDILTALQSQLRGSLCLPDEAGYDEARTIWNAMIDRRPAAVVRCHGASDVMRAVRLAPRQRAPRGRARRGPQHFWQRRLRGRPADRPVANALRSRRSEDAHRAGRARRDAR